MVMAVAGFFAFRSRYPVAGVSVADDYKGR